VFGNKSQVSSPSKIIKIPCPFIYPRETATAYSSSSPFPAGDELHARKKQAAPVIVTTGPPSRCPH
jgi:hypothetical protein